MAITPWFSVALSSMLLYWPGGWPVPVAPEPLACMVLLAALPGGPRAMWLLLPVMGALLQAERNLQHRLPAEYGPLDVIVRGQVCSFPRQSGRASNFVLELDTAAADPGLPRRLQLAWYASGDLPRAGEVWELRVRIRAPRGLASPGAFDGERAALVANIGGRGYVRQGAVNRRLSQGGSHCPTIILRRWVAGRIDEALREHPRKAHLLAITVGVRQHLATQDWGLLRHTGTVHLMAISGLHIGLVAGAALLAARGFGGLLNLVGWRGSPRKLALTASLVAAIGYAALAGFALPTQRALLMLIAWIFFCWVGRGVHAWVTLGIALWLVLMTDGLAILTTSFWLSFGAVVALLMASLACAQSARTKGIWLRLRQLCLAQWRVFAGLLPIAALGFGELAPVAPLANLVAVPAFGLAIMPLAALGVIVTLLDLGSAPLKLAANLLDVLLRWLSWLDVGTVQIPPLPGWYLPAALTGVAALLWPRPLPGRSLAVLALLLAPVLGPRYPATGDLRVWILDVGQGLAVIVQTARHVLVYDTGPVYGSSDAARSVLLPALQQAGIRRLDRIVISHSDRDHAGGLATLSEAHPEALVLAPVPRALQIPARPCRRGQAWSWDGVEFGFLHPSPAHLRGSSNDRSCVLLVRAPAFSVLLPGDITRQQEFRVASQLPAGGVDLLVAPHHGSSTSSSPALVRASEARFVVFAAGYRNRWGFPRRAVVERWRRAGSCLLTTAAEGSLRFGMAHGQLQHLYSHRRDSARGWTLPPEAPACDPAEARL